MSQGRFTRFITVTLEDSLALGLTPARRRALRSLGEHSQAHRLFQNLQDNTRRFERLLDRYGSLLPSIHNPRELNADNHDPETNTLHIPRMPVNYEPHVSDLPLNARNNQFNQTSDDDDDCMSNGSDDSQSFENGEEEREDLGLYSESSLHHYNDVLNFIYDNDAVLVYEIEDLSERLMLGLAENGNWFINPSYVCTAFKQTLLLGKLVDNSRPHKDFSRILFDRVEAAESSLRRICQTANYSYPSLAYPDYVKDGCSQLCLLFGMLSRLKGECRNGFPYTCTDNCDDIHSEHNPIR